MLSLLCYDNEGKLLQNLYQWDTNVTVVVSGMNNRDVSTIKFHFANDKSSIAYVVTPEARENGFAAMIPNSLLMMPDIMSLYVYETNEDESRTVSEIRIPVIPRHKPANVEYTPYVSILKIVNGLKYENGMLYLTSDGDVVGEGAAVSASNPFTTWYTYYLETDPYAGGYCAIAYEYPESSSNYYRDSNTDGSSVDEITVDANPMDNCIAIMFVTYEDGDEPVISGDATWTVIKTFQPTSGSGHLVATVYQATMTRGAKTITLSKQNASTRFHATMRCFYDAGTPTIVDDENPLPSSSYSPSSTDGAPAYYVLASVYANNTGLSVMISSGGGSEEHNSNTDILECYLYSPGSSSPEFSISSAYFTASDCVFIGIRFV